MLEKQVKSDSKITNLREGVRVKAQKAQQAKFNVTVAERHAAQGTGVLRVAAAAPCSSPGGQAPQSRSWLLRTPL